MSQHTVTLPDSGRQLHIRKLSPNALPAIWRQVRVDLPPPAIPVERIDLGEGNIKEEPNPGQPEYVQALAQWSQDAHLEVQRRMLRLVAQFAVVDETDASEVAEYKAVMRAAAGVDLETEDDIEYQFHLRASGNPEAARVACDRHLWIYHIVCVSSRDAQELHDRVNSVSRPSAEAVQAHAESFRS